MLQNPRDVHDHARAKLEALRYSIGTMQKAEKAYAAPRPKTGRFTGYWPNGIRQWHGSFLEGQQTGYWEYYNRVGTHIAQEIHLNL
jgi:hypothetical protein